MERRKFFKSLGLLSLATAMPKFLFGENKPKEKNYILGDNTTNHYDISVKEDKVVEWSQEAGFITEDTERIWVVDLAILPKGMKIEDWLKKVREDRVCLYTSERIKIRPTELKVTVVNGLSPYIYCRVGDFNQEVREHLGGLFKECMFKDVNTGWQINADWSQNYMSIQR